MYRNSVLLKLTSILLVIVFISMPVMLIAQQEGNDYFQGKMIGEQAAKGNPLWILAGVGCGIFGAGAAYFTKPNPPSQALLGKSPEYIMGFTEGYQKKSRSINTGYACGGWAGFALIYLLALSSAAS